MRVSKTFWLVFFSFAAVACGKSRWQVDISALDYAPRFERMDQAIFSINPNTATQQYDSLLQSIGTPYRDYIEDILRTGKADNPMTASLLMRFSTDPAWQALQAHVEQQFPDMTSYEQALSLALRRYAVIFGESGLPRLVAYNSGYNIGIYPADDWLGVGLEWYAGTDHQFVKQLPPDLFPQYKRDKMRPEYLVPNALRGFLLYRFREMEVPEELLSEMVHAGKVAFIAQVLLEDDDERRVLNLDAAHLAWCNKHEYEVWKNLVERDLIFSTNAMDINKLINDGPFTPGFPTESPGGLGRWIGYRMVAQFMDKNPDKTLAELLYRSDARSILKTYKPGR